MLRVPTFQLRGPGEVTQPECLPLVLMWGLSGPLCGRLGRAQRARSCGAITITTERNKREGSGSAFRGLGAWSLFTPLVSSFPQALVYSTNKITFLLMHVSDPYVWSVSLKRGCQSDHSLWSPRAAPGVPEPCLLSLKWRNGEIDPIPQLPR